MKKIVIFISVVALIFSCIKKMEMAKRDVLLDAAPLHIHPAKGVKSESTTNPLHLSAYQIVKQTHGMTWTNDLEGIGKVVQFLDENKDFTAPKFIYPADEVINPIDTTLNTDFLRGYDLIFVRGTVGGEAIYDTIAYIPNDIMREAEKLVTEAFNRQDYLTCYNIFDTIYVFKPITGAEWRELNK